MKFGYRLNWFLIIFVVVRKGESSHPPGSIALLDDEDFAQGSGDWSEANLLGKLQENEIPSATNDSNAVWMAENDESGSGEEGNDEAENLFDNDQVASGMYIDGEDMVASGVWRDPLEDKSELHGLPGSALNIVEHDYYGLSFDIIEQEDSSGFLLNPPTKANKISVPQNLVNRDITEHVPMDIALDSCSSNPCPEDCICTAYSHDAPEYHCERPPGMAERNCDIHLLEIRCHDDKIVINASRAFIEVLEIANGLQRLVLSNDVPAFDTPQDGILCQAQDVDDWKVVVPAPFNKCGTTRSQSETGESHEIIRNQLWTQGVNSSKPMLQAQFECKYKAIYTPAVNHRAVKPTKEGASAELCQIKSSPSPCPKEHQVNADTEFGFNDIVYLTFSDESIPEAEVLSIHRVEFACDEENTMKDVVIKSGCKVDAELLLESSVGVVSCLSVRMPRAVSCPKPSLHVEVTSCPKAAVQMCAHDATILQCSGTFSQRLKRSSKLYANEVAAFNIRYKKMGQPTVKYFPGTNHVHQISPFFNPEEDGQSSALVIVVGVSTIILISLAMVYSAYFISGRTIQSIQVSA